MLSDPVKRRDYDRGDYDDGADYDEEEYSDNKNQGRRRARRGRGFADSVFEQFFRDFGRSQGGGGGMFDSGFGSMFNDPFFADPFANDPFFGGGRSVSSKKKSQGRRADPFGFDLGDFGGSGFSASSSSAHVSFGGFDGSSRSSGKSTSTYTTIEPDGTRRTKTVTTIHHPDGRVEKSVNESCTDSSGRALPAAPSHQRLMHGAGGGPDLAHMGGELRSSGREREGRNHRRK